MKPLLAHLSQDWEHPCAWRIQRAPQGNNRSFEWHKELRTEQTSYSRMASFVVGFGPIEECPMVNDKEQQRALQHKADLDYTWKNAITLAEALFRQRPYLDYVVMYCQDDKFLCDEVCVYLRFSCE